MFMRGKRGYCDGIMIPSDMHLRKHYLGMFLTFFAHVYSLGCKM